jgi:hypothetical protein
MGDGLYLEVEMGWSRFLRDRIWVENRGFSAVYSKRATWRANKHCIAARRIGFRGSS